jgi:hypothetical protein
MLHYIFGNHEAISKVSYSENLPMWVKLIFYMWIFYWPSNKIDGVFPLFTEIAFG